MKKTLTITEARELLRSENVFAVKDGFIFNNQGKYCSGLTFVLKSSFELDKDGKVVSPIQYVEDREVTDSFNLELDGSPKILFGDFWKSQKGAPCFRPKDPVQAKHLLVRVSWGGCFNSHRGYYGNAVQECGATYFRRARSHGGGAGYDYWVLPVGYVHQLDTNVYRIDWEAAREYCSKHSKLQADQRAEADRLYKEKLAAEAESQKNRERFISRLEEIRAELTALKTGVHIYVPTMTLGAERFELNGSNYFYSQENLELAERKLAECRAHKVEAIAQLEARQKAYEELAPKFEALQNRAQAVNLEIVINQEKAVLKKLGWQGSGAYLLEMEYSYSNLQQFDQEIREAEQKLEAQRQAAEKVEREAAAKELGLPNDIHIWKRRGGRTGCSQGWVIGANGLDRDRDRLYNENARRAERYGEGYEIWNQILPGELVIQWSKDCTAAEHKFEVVYRPETVTEAQLERIAEIQAEIADEWEGLTGLASGKESPSIGEGWLGLLTT